MKTEKLLAHIRKNGAVFIRHGSKHDVYENPRTHEYLYVPRHPKTNDYTAEGIIKKSIK
jgi:predicted RNA binding protein YcfA (HicA-like mRNA interferase family)